MSETYTYTKASLNLMKLNLEIDAEEFSQTLEKSKNTLAGSDNLLITFAAALTGEEVTSLDTLVSEHDGNPPTKYDYYCDCCAYMWSEYGLSAPTACPCCTSDNIITQASMDGDLKYFRQYVAWSSEKDANLEVAVGTHRIPILFAGSPLSISLKSFRAMVGTPPTGASIKVDINKNGTTIFTDQGKRPEIAIDAYDSGEITDIDVVTLAKGDYLTMDIDQIGSGDAGKDLVVAGEIEVVP